MTLFLTKFIDLLGFLLLLAVFWQATNRRIDRAVINLVIQGCVLGLITGVMAIANHHYHMLVIAMLLFIIKGALIPFLFHRILQKTSQSIEMDTVISGRYISILALCFIILAYYAVGSVSFPSPPAINGVLPISVSILLLGLLIMMTRKKALLQLIGLMTLENGLFLAALATTLGMPLVVELGVFFDLIITAVIAGTFTNRIQEVFSSTDVDQLNRLRG